MWPFNAAWRAALGAGTTRTIASSIPPCVCPRHGFRGPTPSFFAVDAGGVTTVETCAGAVANLRQTTRTRRSYIAARINLPLATQADNKSSAPLQICRVVLLLLRHRRGAAGLVELQ